MSRDDSPLVREVSPDEGYTYMHRAFFHAFLTHSVLTVEEIKPILAHVMTAHSKYIQPVTHMTGIVSAFALHSGFAFPTTTPYTTPTYQPPRSRPPLDRRRRNRPAHSLHDTNHQRQN